MNRTWQENAAEFGALSKQGYGVRLAVLAACSIEPAKQGRPVKAAGGLIRVTIADFAQQSGVARSTIQAYLDKWDRMVAAGWDVDRKALTPDDVNMDLGGVFTEEFEALTEERPPTRHLSANAMVEAIKADPELARVAEQAAHEARLARLNPPGSTDRIKNDPGVRDLAKRHADGEEVTRAITRVAEAVRTLNWFGATWGDLWDKATPFERGTMTEAVIQIQAEAGVLSMYAQNQDAAS